MRRAIDGTTVALCGIDAPRPSSANTTDSRRLAWTLADSLDAGDAGARRAGGEPSFTGASVDDLDAPAPRRDDVARVARATASSEWRRAVSGSARCPRPTPGRGLDVSRPLAAPARRPGAGHGDCCRRSATWRRVSSVCWWCCTDRRSSAPRCHVTQATIAATSAITPRITMAVITTIQPKSAALGYLGPHALVPTPPYVRSPPREVVRPSDPGTLPTRRIRANEVVRVGAAQGRRSRSGRVGVGPDGPERRRRRGPSARS